MSNDFCLSASKELALLSPSIHCGNSEILNASCTSMIERLFTCDEAETDYTHVISASDAEMIVKISFHSLVQVQRIQIVPTSNPYHQRPLCIKVWSNVQNFNFEDMKELKPNLSFSTLDTTCMVRSTTHLTIYIAADDESQHPVAIERILLYGNVNEANNPCIVNPYGTPTRVQSMCPRSNGGLTFGPHSDAE
jgi:hypothetical protein